MVSPSNEDRICAMFDSFSKTTSRNYFKDLLRAEKRRDKNYQEEPVEYILELLSREDTYPSDFLCFMWTGIPAWWRAKLYIKHFNPCRRNKGQSCCWTSGAILPMRKLQKDWR